MPLTPADVHNVAFKKPPIGKRGYDEEEVDAFLDEVERELVRLIDEGTALRAQIDRGGGDDGHEADHRALAELAHVRAQVDHARREQQAAEQAALELQAELRRARANADAGASLSGESDDDDHGARVLMMAHRTADEHIDDARQEADTLLSTAHNTAEEILREARATASSLEREARSRHQREITALDEKRSELLRQVEGLAMFVKDYRSRLQDALTQQLNDVDIVTPSSGRGTAEAEREPLAHTSPGASLHPPRSAL